MTNLMYRPAKSLQRDLDQAKKRIKRLRAYIKAVESQPDGEFDPKLAEMRIDLKKRGDIE